MTLSIDARARIIRDAGAGVVFGPARFDAIEAEARRQIREAVADALSARGHDQQNDRENFYAHERAE